MEWWRFADDAAELVQECEAMLAGHSAGVLARRDAPVPSWAWINFLAHGSELEIRAIARTRPAGDGWLEAQGFLAAEIVTLVDAGATSLADLQQRVLRPLELEAMGAGHAELPSPARVIMQVMAAIESVRTHPQL